MNIFKSVAIAAISAATVIASPALASVTEGERNLVSALDQAGVEVHVGECPTDKAYGLYFPSKNAIAICTNVATTVEQRWETLRHEAVHAAQRCVNPSMAFTVKSSDYLLKNGLQSDWSFIQKAYDREDWAIELEAFTLMRSSNSNVASVVNSACN